MMRGERVTDPTLSIDAAGWNRMVAGAAGWVALHREALNKINVYPVPDGDTGANLGRTLAASAGALDGIAEGASLTEVAAAASDAALLGARGSSGVIGSQWLRGLTGALQGHERVDVALLQSALTAAAEAARAAVSEPREGTMISVAREAAALAAEHQTDSVVDLLDVAVTEAYAAVERTPQLNQVLADAGVVDAGARGLEMMLRGMLAGARGDALPATPEDFGDIDPSWLSRRLDSGDGFDGFCTELVVAGVSDLEQLRLTLVDIATAPLEGDAGAEETLMLAPDGERLRIHLHTTEPELAYARLDEQAEIRAFRAIDMRAQAARVHEGEEDAAVLAVVQGAGFVRVFRQLGATALISGGASDNPSVEMILSAAESTHAGEVVVLPNHGNVVPAATRARDVSEDAQLFVLDCDTQAAGVAALISRIGGVPTQDVVSEMEEGIEAVLIGEVSHAARAIRGDIPLVEGQPFAMLDGAIVAGCETTSAAAAELAQRMIEKQPDGSLLTIYAGEEPSDAEADALVQAIAEQTGLEVDLVWGDQPHYPWLLALE